MAAVEVRIEPVKQMYAPMRTLYVHQPSEARIPGMRIQVKEQTSVMSPPRSITADQSVLRPILKKSREAPLIPHPRRANVPVKSSNPNSTLRIA